MLIIGPVFKVFSSLLLFRACFEELQHDYLIFWFITDFLADLVYLADMVFRTRTGEHICVTPTLLNNSAEEDTDTMCDCRVSGAGSAG